jgi:hypothetical protein
VTEGLSSPPKEIDGTAALAEPEGVFYVIDALKLRPRAPLDQAERETERLECCKVFPRIVPEPAHPVGPKLAEEDNLRIRPEQVPRTVDRSELGALK